MRRASVVVAAAGAMALVVGCAGDERPVALRHPATTTPDSSAGTTAVDDCPSTLAGKGGGYAAVDYVDFVQANGHNYIAGLHPVAPIRASDLGSRVLTVRCSFSQLNDRTKRMTPKPRDGDAAFLTPGTPVYSVNGWPATCRLAAREGGQLRVFLAYRSGGTVATPEDCALHPGG
jgi:hypothetical protein